MSWNKFLLLKNWNRTEMWVAILLFLFSCEGIWGKSGEEFCGGSIIRACEPKVPFPWEFPGTAEEVDRLCPIFLERLECLQRYTDECGDDHMLARDNFIKIMAYVRKVCDEDSDIRKDALKQLPCIKEVVDDPDSTCENLTRQAIELYEEHEISKLKDNQNEFSIYNDKFQCFYSTFSLACLTADVDRKCGAAAKDLILDAQNQVGFVESCPADEEFLELVEAIEIRMEHKVLIKKIIDLNAKIEH